MDAGITEPETTQAGKWRVEFLPFDQYKRTGEFGNSWPSLLRSGKRLHRNDWFKLAAELNALEAEVETLRQRKHIHDGQSCEVCREGDEATLAAEADRDAWKALAEQGEVAVRAWDDALKARYSQSMPIGATPSTHPEIFGAHLKAAKDANQMLKDWLAHYDALVNPKESGNA